MITVANRIYVRPEYAEAFEARFRERAGLVDKMPGFVSNMVLRPVNEGDPANVMAIDRPGNSTADAEVLGGGGVYFLQEGIHLSLVRVADD